MPFFERNEWRMQQWRALVREDGGREMESGLLRLAASFLIRLQTRFGATWDQITEYVLNNAAVWQFPVIAAENAERRTAEQAQWEQRLSTLDTALLSLLGEQEVPQDQVAIALDHILASSLWERRTARYSEEIQRALKGIVHTRSRFLWANTTTVQRRSYFLAGLGYEAGRRIDAIAPQANLLLVQANAAILRNDADPAIARIITLAELIFANEPFVPDPLPDNWRSILRAWLSGVPLSQLGQADEDVLRFIENGLIYVLPWGMEAIRVRAAATGELIDGPIPLPIDDFETGLAVPAVETGTLNRSAAFLMQAGFNSRTAAIRAVTDTNATFSNSAELRAWLNSETVRVHTTNNNWPSPEAAPVWREFVASFVPRERTVWLDWTYSDVANWTATDDKIVPGAAVRVRPSYDGAQTLLLAGDFEILGRLTHRLNPEARGLIRATINGDRTTINMEYVGPADLTIEQAQQA